MNIFKYFLILLLLIPLASADTYNLSGYVTNNLQFPLENARVDFNNTHIFTDSEGYYNFSNVSSGNYTVLARYIAPKIGEGHFMNSTQNISISGDTSLNITIREKSYPIPVTPGFEGLGLIFVFGVLFMIRRK